MLAAARCGGLLLLWVAWGLHSHAANRVRLKSDICLLLQCVVRLVIKLSLFCQAAEVQPLYQKQPELLLLQNTQQE